MKKLLIVSIAALCFNLKSSAQKDSSKTLHIDSLIITADKISLCARNAKATFRKTNYVTLLKIEPADITAIGKTIIDTSISKH